MRIPHGGDRTKRFRATARNKENSATAKVNNLTAPLPSLNAESCAPTLEADSIGGIDSAGFRVSQYLDTHETRNQIHSQSIVLATFSAFGSGTIRTVRKKFDSGEIHRRRFSFKLTSRLVTSNTVVMATA
jgi:hypothetical protein